MDRLKHPRRSPVSESAPDWNTTASGAYISITLQEGHCEQALEPRSEARMITSSVNAPADARRKRRTFSVGRVHGLNDPPALAITGLNSKL
jgi:hypothetical protein